MLADPQPFFSFNIGHVIELGVLGLAYLAYRSDRTKEQAAQTQMHAANTARLDELVRITREEREANSKRDQQIGELQRQTAALMEMARGLERRLRMLEDKDNRRVS